MLGKAAKRNSDAKLKRENEEKAIVHALLTTAIHACAKQVKIYPLFYHFETEWEQLMAYLRTTVRKSQGDLDKSLAAVAGEETGLQGGVMILSNWRFPIFISPGTYLTCVHRLRLMAKIDPSQMGTPTPDVKIEIAFAKRPYDLYISFHPFCGHAVICLRGFDSSVDDRKLVTDIDKLLDEFADLVARDMANAENT